MAFDEKLADRVRAYLFTKVGYSERKMFGGMCYMINGNMCCGVVNSDIMLRLTPDLAAEALQDPNVREMDFTGRPMKGMVYVNEEGHKADQDMLRWLDVAYGHASSLPPKQKK